MRSPCVRTLLCVVVTCVLCSGANADPDDLEGGVFIAHHPPTFQYSPGMDWCEEYAQSYSISSCEEQNPRIDLDGNLGERSLWYVIAAWSEAKTWCGSQFGFGSFDPAIYEFMEYGGCLPNDLSISTDGWPGPNEGTVVTATDVQWSGNFQAVYYFSGYAYYEGQIPLGIDPGNSFGGFGNCSAPSETWESAGYGAMGLFIDGVQACTDSMWGEDSTPPPYAHEDDLLDVMFAPASCVRIRDGDLVDLLTDALSGVAETLLEVEPYEWRRYCEVPEAALDSMQTYGQTKWPVPLYNLNNMYRLVLSPDEDIWAVSQQLEELPGIVYARPVPEPVPLPTVPDFESEQEYLDPGSLTPAGLDSRFSWTRPGGDGTGVTITDVERTWNYDHGDLSKASGSQLRPLCYEWEGDNDHGTAVLGVLASDNNGWGTTGMSFGSDIQTSCTYLVDLEGRKYEDIPGAITVAVYRSEPGDVILLEVQWPYWGSDTRTYIPIEWYGRYSPESQGVNPVYATIANAVANGILVVEAGGNDYTGNGGADTGLLDWEGDSGAIIVGGGRVSVGADRYRYDYSAFGPRFNLQGWGGGVVTTGDGDRYSDDGPNFYYDRDFGGTSSASATVAGATACFVGFWNENGAPTPPSPLFVRDMLVATGTPQRSGMGVNEHIGPRPDLRAAIEATDEHDVIITPYGHGTYATIQDAVDAAQSGDVIGLTNGTFTGNGNRDLDFHGKDLVLHSISGDPTLCIIELEGSSQDPHRAFYLRSGETRNAIIEGVTITGGHAKAGQYYPGGFGGVVVCGDYNDYQANASPTFRNCVFTGNYAEWRGGVAYAWDGGPATSPLFVDCVFESNDSNGAACASTRFGEYVGCHFRDNGDTDATIGVIECMAATIAQCTLEGNGGLRSIYCSVDGGTVIDGCTIVENAGGVKCIGSQPMLSNTIIADCSSGPAVDCSPTSPPTLICCDLHGNAGGDWTGGIESQLGVDGNVSEDPHFCYTGSADGHPYTLHEASICLPTNHPLNCLIGAWPIGCPTTDVDGLEDNPPPDILLQVRNCLSQGNPVRISFEVPLGWVKERFELTLHDIEGRMIRELDAGETTPGWHDFHWDGSSDLDGQAGTGVYFCRLRVGDRVLGGRIVWVD